MSRGQVDRINIGKPIHIGGHDQLFAVRAPRRCEIKRIVLRQSVDIRSVDIHDIDLFPMFFLVRLRRVREPAREWAAKPRRGEQDFVREAMTDQPRIFAVERILFLGLEFPVLEIEEFQRDRDASAFILRDAFHQRERAGRRPFRVIDGFRRDRIAPIAGGGCADHEKVSRQLQVFADHLGNFFRQAVDIAEARSFDEIRHGDREPFVRRLIDDDMNLRKRRTTNTEQDDAEKKQSFHGYAPLYSRGLTVQQSRL